MYNYSKYSDKEILSFIASLEKQSSHPIASAFSDIKTKYLVDEFENIPGIGIHGVVEDKDIYIGNDKLFEKLKIQNENSKDEKTLTNQLNSILYVIFDKKVVALIGVKDIVRNDVKETISNLKKINKNVIMLSGDNEKVATLVGKSLGIDKVIANVVPKEKEQVIKEEMKKSRVMMVGDGINDALALTVADIGVSINSGTDIAMDVSDVILMNSDLKKIVSLIETSKKTLKIIKENLFWAFFYNICMIPIAIGLLKGIGITISPMFGSIFMTISSLTVVLNSLRLRK
jgi:P-type E1-E2 ATPase